MFNNYILSLQQKEINIREDANSKKIFYKSIVIYIILLIIFVFFLFLSIKYLNEYLSPQKIKSNIRHFKTFPNNISVDLPFFSKIDLEKNLTNFFQKSNNLNKINPLELIKNDNLEEIKQDLMNHVLKKEFLEVRKSTLQENIKNSKFLLKAYSLKELENIDNSTLPLVTKNEVINLEKMTKHFEFTRIQNIFRTLKLNQEELDYLVKNLELELAALEKKHENFSIISKDFEFFSKNYSLRYFIIPIRFVINFFKGMM